VDQHRELLARAGQVPDGWLAIAREVLAAGDTGRLAELLAALDESKTPAPHYNFAPEPDGHEPTDSALVAAVTGEGVDACWATMRDGTDRVYLVQAGVDADLPAVTAAGQHALAAWEDTPKVEVFGHDHPLPGYHEQALLAATLLWSATSEPPVTVARAFDGAGADGPWFAADHELVVDPMQRRRLLDFLAGGEVVLTATGRLVDVLTGAAEVVPASLRSDGTWVWSEATRYYLDRYQLAPDPELAGHAMANRPSGRLCPLTRHRVRAALNPTDQKGPSWRAG
jgi:hypothetical protein